MPVHDWSHVDSGVFHDFHQAWIIEIRNSLNDGRLPDSFYALAEQVAQGPIPDVVTLELAPRNDQTNPGSRWDKEGGLSSAVAVAETPPRVSHTHEAATDLYASRASRVAVRHVSGDEIVGYIEVMSPGNKHSESAFRSFGDKLFAALQNGIHSLVIDLHAPTARDTCGFHATFMRDWYGDPSPPGVSEICPLGLSAYRCNGAITCYFEPTAVSKVLIDMPAFLTTGLYVNVPLEETYIQAWRGVPRRWKEVIEAT